MVVWTVILPPTAIAVVTLLVLSLGVAQAGQSGQVTHDSVLIGMHFVSDGNPDNLGSAFEGKDPLNVTPGLSDYLKYMPRDLAHMSYADFWRWWYELERYKGDEAGLSRLDAIARTCLANGMKVKIDLAHSTWWTQNLDWENEALPVVGPADLDDWVHLCDLLARRYKGSIALWLLQGEANVLESYWPGLTMDHVHEVYRLGYRAFKRVDPGVFISISGAAQCMPREPMDEWYRSNISACRGCYDDIPVNYFGDVPGGDVYHGLINYYQSIRSMLDDVGERDVEIGSGESCVQWCLDSYDPPKDPPTSMVGFDPDKTPISELKQAWRMNETLGTFYHAGGNKWMMWGTEFAPGGGWPWRWGFRKYEDWWGIWPATHKVPGTNIVYRYDCPDGRRADLRAGWTSAQTDPYHPCWHVFRFWAQAAPPAAEAVRLPAIVTGSGPRILRLATYLRTADRCVALIQTDKPTPISADIDVRKTGWAEGTVLRARVRNEQIDYATGAVRVNKEDASIASVTRGAVRLRIPPTVGFTTVEFAPADPALAACCVSERVLPPAEVGKPLRAVVVLRNTGSQEWRGGDVSLGLCGHTGPGDGAAYALPADVRSGNTVTVTVSLPTPDSPGYVTHLLRMRDREGQWFGPAFAISAHIADLDAPRKLVAFRELGHVRLKWFAPLRQASSSGYAVYRADGFEQPFRLLKKVQDTSYVDADLTRDKAYYYRVAALDSKGRPGRPSNEDNAKALSVARIYDAELSAPVPAEMKPGEKTTLTVTVTNTGSKAWDLRRPDRIIYSLAATQQWGVQDEGSLPAYALGDEGIIEPGQQVAVAVPYTAPREGRFENHWVMRVLVPGQRSAYFGTPLLSETDIVSNQASDGLRTDDLPLSTGPK